MCYFLFVFLFSFVLFDLVWLKSTSTGTSTVALIICECVCMRSVGGIICRWWGLFSLVLFCFVLFCSGGWGASNDRDARYVRGGKIPEICGVVVVGEGAGM